MAAGKLVNDMSSCTSRAFKLLLTPVDFMEATRDLAKLQ